MVEVMVMVGILAIFSMGVMGLSASLSKQNKYANVNNGARALANVLAGITSYPALCKSMLSTSTSTFNGGQAVSVNGLPLAFNLNNTGTVVRDNEELKDYDVKVTSLRFKAPSPLTSAGTDPAQAGNTLYVGQLLLTVENRAGTETKLGGNSMKERTVGTLTLSVTSSGTITNCFATMDLAQACIDMGGTPNPNGTPKCKLPYPCNGQSNIFLGYNDTGNPICKGVNQLAGDACPNESFIISKGNGSGGCKYVSEVIQEAGGNPQQPGGPGTVVRTPTPTPTPQSQASN